MYSVSVIDLEVRSGSVPHNRTYSVLSCSLPNLHYLCMLFSLDLDNWLMFKSFKSMC